MKEIDRIISKGVISEEFLKSEIREDFFVDEKRKKIWAVELDILLLFDTLCKEHNLTYFLMHGTLLGAVRHKGFIPWDDDIDVVMPREDYDKFLSLAKMIEEPYFLQTPITDSESGFSMAKLKNSNTTCVNEMFKYQNMNFGIHIDILPLDNFVDEGAKERYEKINALNIDSSTYMRMKNPNLDEKNKKRVKNYSGKTPDEIFKEVERLSSQFEDVDTDKVTVAPLTLYPLENNIFEKCDFSDKLIWKFEGFEFPIPIGFDRVLTVMYGDYNTLPPQEERGNWHSGARFDPDISYKEYLKVNR